MRVPCLRHRRDLSVIGVYFKDWERREGSLRLPTDVVEPSIDENRPMHSSSSDGGNISALVTTFVENRGTWTQLCLFSSSLRFSGERPRDVRLLLDYPPGSLCRYQAEVWVKNANNAAGRQRPQRSERGFGRGWGQKGAENEGTIRPLRTSA